MSVPLLRDARPAGWVNCFSICASAMPRAKNRTEKGSILNEDEELCQSWYDLSGRSYPFPGKYKKSHQLMLKNLRQVKEHNREEAGVTNRVTLSLLNVISLLHEQN